MSLIPGFESAVGAAPPFTTTLPHNMTGYWEDLPFAHPYWKQFDLEAIPDFWHYLIALWMTFFGIFGTLGNLLVIFIFIKTRTLRTASNMLIINLALGDMTFSAVNGFPLLTISSINKKWIWGQLWCEIYGYIGGLFGFISINTLAVIAMDRYQVITKPLQASRRMSHKKAFFSIVLVWMASLVWSTLPFFGFGHYIPEGFQTSCTFDYLSRDQGNVIFVTLMYVLGFLLPVLVIFYCYIGIVKAVFKQAMEMHNISAKMGAKMSKDDSKMRQEIQTTKVAALTIISFLLSWTPYAIIGLIGMLADYEDKAITPFMSEIPVMFAKASAAYNPIIYALSHPKFRAEIDKTMPWLLSCCKPKLEASTTNSKLGRADSQMSKEVSSDVTEMTVSEPRANPAV